VPWVLSSAELGPHVLEAGPGPGLTTDRLRSAVPRLTAIEADQELAQSLRARLRDTNVEIVNGDATSMPFPDAEFSGCAAFTMLHHVPSPALQDKLLREVGGFSNREGPSSAVTACKAYSCGRSIWVTRLSRFVRIPLAHALKMPDSK
jgi:ubiquinone/menaquinone biosynthesis C-methylase UbiE